MDGRFFRLSRFGLHRSQAPKLVSNCSVEYFVLGILVLCLGAMGHNAEIIIGAAGDLAQASTIRAGEPGELQGTPENMDAINKAEQQAGSYQHSANDERYGPFWISIIEQIFDD